MRKEIGVTVYKLGKKGFEAIKKATKPNKKPKKPLNKEKLGKAIIAGSAVSSVPLSFLAQKTGEIQREAQKPVERLDKKTVQPKIEKLDKKRVKPKLEKIAKKTDKKPKLEKIAKKTAKKPKLEKPAKKIDKELKVIFKNGVAHDADTGKPL